MIEAINICKSFYKCTVLEQFNAKIEKKKLTVITGESGKGKTTLMNILSCLEKPDSGVISFDEISNPGPKEVMKLRRHSISYIFQNYGLVNEYTVDQNLRISLTYRRNTQISISEALSAVGLSGCENRKVYELSGGEQQRIALARVLLKDSSYVFADEPTGNLDKGNRDIVINLLREMADSGKGVVLATHDLDLLSYADQHIRL